MRERYKYALYLKTENINHVYKKIVLYFPAHKQVMICKEITPGIDVHLIQLFGLKE